MNIPPTHINTLMLNFDIIAIQNINGMVYFEDEIVIKFIY